jgi:ATP synthase protein I
MMAHKRGNEDRKKVSAKGDFMRFLGVASTVGINLVVSTFVGFAIGYWLIDKHFNTSPWFTVVFTLLGIIAGFRYLFKIASRAEHYEDTEDNGADEG